MNTDEGVNIVSILKDRSEKIAGPAGRRITVLKEEAASHIASSLRVSLKDVYAEALRNDIVPLRYLRNGEGIGIEDQLKLLDARIGVAGAGGLGGHVAVLLARIGIGGLVIVDGDRFDETNLNRQLLADAASIGRFKSQAAVDAIGGINPSVHAVPVVERICSENAVTLFRDCHVIVDALDNVPDRFVLQAAAAALNIPLVHGAIAGFSGQVMTIFPGDTGLRAIYGDSTGESKAGMAPEAVQGVPSITPAMIAAFQAMEVVKIVLGQGRVFRGRMAHLDLWSGELMALDLSKT